MLTAEHMHNEMYLQIIGRLQTDIDLLSLQRNDVNDELERANKMAAYNKVFHYLDISISTN